MRQIITLITCYLIPALWFAAAADEVKSVDFGAATVIYDYQPAREGVATLSLNALVTETNDSLRGLKNSDRRRLGKLGQLIYQCKLLLYRPQGGGEAEGMTPMLISRNYSLYTGVDLRLAEGERLGIKIRSLQSVDGESLFTPALGGGGDLQQEVWENVGDGPVIDLKQVNLNALSEGDVIATADNIDIILRFPIFQVQKPVNQWSYNFSLEDFRRAVRHADENCTPDRLEGLIEKNS